ncbi:MAG: hypothetical protein HQK53_16365 [Oligoflexia bacterium]|nr:hypothetical protein [Oligoflexia bacterium]
MKWCCVSTYCIICLMCILCNIFAIETDNSIQAAQSTMPTQPNSSAKYGSIYLLEQKEMVVFPWQFEVTFNKEFGNPYEVVNGVSVSAQHSIGQYVWVGLLFNKNYSTRTEMTQTAINELNVAKFGLAIKTPTHSEYAIINLVPFTGYSCFFGSRPLEMDIDLQLGIGSVTYKQGGRRLALTYSIRPGIWFTKRFALQLGAGHDWEAPFTSEAVNNARGEIGLAMRF